MTLNDAQKQTVTKWIAEGLKLSEIQDRLASELGFRLTYMEVRLLVDDLKLVPKDPPPPQPVKLSAPGDLTGKPPPQTPQGKIAPGQTAPKAAQPAGAGGGVSLAVDTVARPGALVSGSVTFSDGQQAVWYMDQLGRMGLGPKQQGYKPSQTDLEAFQQALEAELSKLGL